MPPDHEVARLAVIGGGVYTVILSAWTYIGVSPEHGAFLSLILTPIATAVARVAFDYYKWRAQLREEPKK